MRMVPRTFIFSALVCGALFTEFSGAAGQGFRAEPLYDPVLNMKAYDIFIPVSWKYQATLVPGDSCDNTPTPVFRAYSPDGLTEFRRMPRFDWSWSNAPYASPRQADCLPLDHDVSPVEFAQSLAKIQGAKFDGEMPLNPQTAQTFKQGIENDNAAIQAQGGQRPFRGSAAAARIEYQNGSFVIEEQLRVLIRCVHNNLAGFGGGRQYFRENCGADVRVLRAPKGKLDGLVILIDSGRTGASSDPQWLRAYTNARQRETDQIVGDIHNRMRAGQAQFEEAQRVRAQQNRDFQTSLRAGYGAQNERARQVQGEYAAHNGKVMANMDARHTPASDWVDFALDQQTVSGTGGMVKVPSGYSQVWANNSGQYFLTNDLNTNPNGNLPGDWSQQTQVHGNGLE